MRNNVGGVVASEQKSVSIPFPHIVVCSCRAEQEEGRPPWGQLEPPHAHCSLTRRRLGFRISIHLPLGPHLVLFEICASNKHFGCTPNPSPYLLPPSLSSTLPPPDVAASGAASTPPIAARRPRDPGCLPGPAGCTFPRRARLPSASVNALFSLLPPLCCCHLLPATAPSCSSSPPPRRALQRRRPVVLLWASPRSATCASAAELVSCHPTSLTEKKLGQETTKKLHHFECYIATFHFIIFNISPLNFNI